MARYDGNLSDSDGSGDFSGFEEDDLDKKSIGSDISMDSEVSDELSPANSDDEDLEAKIKEETEIEEGRPRG